MTRFSVVTPVFNSARWLPETLDSVAALATPHEHIVIDGGSDDGTVQLLEARDDPALSWVSEPDRGQTHAVNKGLARARGEILGWLNGDDTYVPQGVDRALDHLDRNPDVMAVYGGLDFTDQHGAVQREHRPAEWSWRRYLYLGDYVPTPTIVFRRELLERAGLLDERWVDAADYDFYLRLLHGARVDRLPWALVRFRFHPESKSSRDVWIQQDEALQIRLRWARSGLDRAVMNGFEGAKRAVLPRISPWPEPYPTPKLVLAWQALQRVARSAASASRQ